MSVEDTVKTLAEGLKINVQSGEQAVGNGGSGGVKTVAVQFTKPFNSTPRVFVTPRNQPGTNWPDTYGLSIRKVDSKGFIVNLVRVDEHMKGWGQNLMLDWFAVEQ